MSKKNNQITIRSSAAEYLTFLASTSVDNQKIEIRYEDENLWLTQKLISNLYDVEVNTINYHIKKIFTDNELEENSVILNFRITANDGKTYNTKHYNLSMIIAIGFKVDNEKAVQFRKWANKIVNEYTIKGFSMDDERLKNDGSIREILNDSGKISVEIAKAHALSEFEKYRIVQDKLYISDFDKAIIQNKGEE